MTFVNGAFLAALLPILLLPPLIHLLNRTFPVQFRFPDLTHLRRTVAQRSRLYTHRHLILMLIRALFIALLIAVFLKPLWEQYGGVSQPSAKRQVVIALDHSLSMEYEAQGVSPRKRAIQEATKIINSLAPEDLVNVLLVEDTAHPLVMMPTSDHAQPRGLLQELGVGFGQADFTAVNRAITEQLVNEDANKEVYYISDFQRSNWAATDFSALPQGTRCLFVDVGHLEAENRGILNVQLGRAMLHAGDDAVLEVLIGNYSGEPFDGPVSLLVNDQMQLQEKAAIAPWSSGKVQFAVMFGDAGPHRCEIRIPRDDLPGDNRHFVVLNVLDREPVLLVTDADPKQRVPAFFLEAALNPFGSAGRRGGMEPALCMTDELNTSRLAATRKVFLSEIGLVSPDVSSRLAQFVFEGGSIIYFLDGKHDAQNLKILEQPFGEMPLALYEYQELAQVADGGQQISRGDFRSPHLQLFRGALRRNLGLLEFYDFYRAGATGTGRVLLHYTDGIPAMASLHHGLGTLLLMNFSIGELSSNMARQRIFPAWMHELVESLNVAEPLPVSFSVGERVHGEVWKDAMHREGIRTPSGDRLPVMFEKQGARYTISFVPPIPGFYTLGQPLLKYAAAVNPPAAESDMRRVDRKRLSVNTDGNSLGHFLAEHVDYNHVAWGLPVFHIFLLAAIACLAVEVLFQRLVQKLAEGP